MEAVRALKFAVNWKGETRSMSASLIGRLGSSAFRLSAITVSMSLAGRRDRIRRSGSARQRRPAHTAEVIVRYSG
jgi:hypothetical protein